MSIICDTATDDVFICVCAAMCLCVGDCVLVLVLVLVCVCVCVCVRVLLCVLLSHRRMVSCVHCGRKMHRICVLYFEPLWPEG